MRLIRIFVILCFFWACVPSADEMESSTYIVARDRGGAPSVCIRLRWTPLSGSSLTKDQQGAVALIQQRNDLLAKGQVEKAIALYREGESRTVAKEDFTPTESAVQFAKDNTFFFDSIASSNNVFVIYYTMGKSPTESIPWFEAVRKKVTANESTMMIDRQIGMDSFVVCASGLIKPEEKLKDETGLSENGFWVEVNYGDDEPVERRLNIGERPKNDSAYLWVNGEKLPSPIPFSEAKNSMKLSKKATEKCRKITQFIENQNPMDAYRHPMYERLRIDANDYHIVSIISVADTEVLIIESKTQSRSRGMAVDCTNDRLDEISSLQEMLNFQSIPMLMEISSAKE